MHKLELPWSKDGIEYSSEDAVNIWCDDCKGCNKCCENMSDTIILDPYDIWQLTHKLKVAGGGSVDFALLVSEDGPLELSVTKGVILPHMKMVETEREDVGACSFLTEQGRCGIHFCRPGICRLYPLARNYTVNEKGQEEVGYFILRPELGCSAKNTTQVMVSKWIGIEPMDKYQDFLIKWHNIRKNLGDELTSSDKEDEQAIAENQKKQNKMLSLFFATPYGDDFFAEFDERYASWNL